MTRVCTKCEIEKPFSEFFGGGGYRDGIKPQCKPCARPAARQAKNGFSRRLRLSAVQELGSVCVRCGFSDVRALQIDHINGGGVREAKELGSREAIYRKVVAGETGYQLLCANCNWIKRYENNETAAGYRERG